MSRRILIVETDGTGHRLSYVRQLLDHAAADECTVLLPADESISAHIDLHLGARAETATRHATPDWRAVEQASREARADLVVVPDGDRHLPALVKRAGWQGTGQLRLLLLRDPWMPTAEAGWRHKRARFAKRGIVRLLNASSGIEVLSLMPASQTPWTTPLQRVEDPIELKVMDTEVAKWALEPDRFWFAVLGAITQRKNVPIVLSAALQVAPQIRIGLLVAGETDSAVDEVLDAMAPRMRDAGILVRRRNDLLTDIELDAAVSACDCLVVAHSNNGPSGLFGKAIVAGTRILASGAESLRQDCAAVGSGAIWVPLDEGSLADGMVRSASSSRPTPLKVGATTDFAAQLLK